VLIVRPRGWHLDEKHVLVDGQRLSASLFDLGLFCFHNAAALAAKDRGPYFYLPKLQSMEEAALWNAVLGDIETMLGLPHGQMKVTVLIETLPAAFEMDEILHALRTASSASTAAAGTTSFPTSRPAPAPRPGAARARPGDDGAAVPARLLGTCW
jgi:malate synthase A